MEIRRDGTENQMSGGAVDGWTDRVVELWSGGAVERWSGGVEERCSVRTEERWSHGDEERWSRWKRTSGGVLEWRSGAMVARFGALERYRALGLFRAVEWWSGGAVVRWFGGAVERWSGGAV